MKILKYVKIAILDISIFKTKVNKIKCSYCDSENTDKLRYKNTTGYKPSLVKCNNCKSIFYTKGK